MSVSLLQRVSQHLSDAGLLAGYDVVYLKWTDQRIAENKPFALFRLAGTEGVSNYCVQYPDVRILLVGLPTTAVDTLDDMAAIIEHFRQSFIESGDNAASFEPIGPIIGPLYLENGRPVMEITVRCMAEDAYFPRPTADKTALVAALNSATALVQEDYTAATWAVLAAAVTAGQNVNAETYASQASVDEATAEILAAIAALQLFPLQLFAAAQEGAWLSQEDAGTLFGGTDGSDPVTASGQSEGLILDKRTGGERVDLGDAANFANNGFDVFAQTADGFTAEKTTPGGNDYGISGNLFAVEVGKVYEVLFNVDQVSGITDVFFSSGTNDRSTFGKFSTTGAHRRFIYSDVVDGSFSLSFKTATVGPLAISGVTVREVVGNNATQPTSLAKPTFNDDGTHQWASFDGSDDAILFDVPVGGWTGTYVQGTMAGVIVGEISVPAGTYQIPDSPMFANDGTMTDLIARDDGGVITTDELEQLVGYVGRRGAVADFSSSTSMVAWFRNRDDFVSLDCSRWDVSAVSSFSVFALNAGNLVTLDVSTWDTSSATSFNEFVRSCSNLAALDVSGWNTSSVTTFRFFAGGCGALTALDVSGWDTSSAESFTFFINGCSSITELDVSSWNTSSVTIFASFANNCSSLSDVTVYGGTGSPFADSPCTDYANAFTGTNLTQQSIDDILTAIAAGYALHGSTGGRFDQSGGSAPSAVGEAAIDALRAAGMAVTVTGGY